MSERENILNNLIQLRNPLADLLSSLQELEWDSESTLVELKPTDIQSTLDRYLRKELNAEDVENWANAIESRDDIDYRQYIDIVHQLANPLLTEKLSPEIAQALIQKL